MSPARSRTLTCLVIAGKLMRFTGVVVGDDGKVVKLLAKGEARPATDARVDAGGKTLLPGLIDAHGHVVDSPGQGLGLGLLIQQLDLSGTDSIDRVTRLLTARTPAVLVGENGTVVGILTRYDMLQFIAGGE